MAREDEIDERTTVAIRHAVRLDQPLSADSNRSARDLLGTGGALTPIQDHQHAWRC